MMNVAAGRLYSYAQDLEDSKRLPGHLQQVYDPPPIPPTIPGASTVIDKLIQDNQDVWVKLLNNKFCETGYNSSADNFNATYKRYAREDYKYLIEYARFINYRYLQDPATRTSAGLKEMVEYLPKKVKDVDDFFGFCVKDMKISEADLLEDKVSPQVLGYTSWEQMYAMTDDVYSTTVRMIPCVYGWNQIALKLKASGPGVPGTFFYNYWYNGIDPALAVKLNKYLEDNFTLYGCNANWEKWNTAFRQACLFEIAFFDAALNKNLPKL